MPSSPVFSANQSTQILALFEICAHPNHSTDRSASGMMMLDRIIRTLSLTMMDLNDPNTSTFSPGKVPAVLAQQTHPNHDVIHNGFSYAHHGHDHTSSLPVSSDRGCSCLSLTLGEQWMPAFEHTPLWTQTPAWNASWSEAEIRKESCRRLCWSAMTLAAGHSAYSSASRTHGVNLFISDPSNVSYSAANDCRLFTIDSMPFCSLARRWPTRQRPKTPYGRCSTAHSSYGTRASKCETIPRLPSWIKANSQSRHGSRPTPSKRL